MVCFDILKSPYDMMEWVNCYTNSHAVTQPTPHQHEIGTVTKFVKFVK